MRNKVYLIRGWLNLAAKITTAEFERINAEHVLLITALRRPQLLPPDIDMDPNSITIQYKKIMEHWKVTDCVHFLTAEYANMVLDHGGSDVRAVEGNPLIVPWFYETVRSIHKSFGQIVIEVAISGNRVQIEDEEISLELAIDRLGSRNPLG